MLQFESLNSVTSVWCVCGAPDEHTSHDFYNIAEAVTDMKHYYY